MTLKINRVDDNSMVIVVSGTAAMRDFKELVQRATNLWPDASPRIKQFADEVTNSELIGKHYPSGRLQNYETQDSSPRDKLERRALQCDNCQTENLVDVLKGADKVTWKCSHCMATNISEKL